MIRVARFPSTAIAVGWVLFPLVSCRRNLWRRLERRWRNDVPWQSGPGANGPPLWGHLSILDSARWRHALRNLRVGLHLFSFLACERRLAPARRQRVGGWRARHSRIRYARIS